MVVPVAARVECLILPFSKVMLSDISSISVSPALVIRSTFEQMLNTGRKTLSASRCAYSKVCFVVVLVAGVLSLCLSGPDKE